MSVAMSWSLCVCMCLGSTAPVWGCMERFNGILWAYRGMATVHPVPQIRIQKLSFSPPPTFLFIYLFNTINTLICHPRSSPSNSEFVISYLDEWVYTRRCMLLGALTLDLWAGLVQDGLDAKHWRSDEHQGIETAQERIYHTIIWYGIL